MSAKDIAEQYVGNTQPIDADRTPDPALVRDVLNEITIIAQRYRDELMELRETYAMTRKRSETAIGGLQKELERVNQLQVEMKNNSMMRENYRAEEDKKMALWCGKMENKIRALTDENKALNEELDRRKILEREYEEKISALMKENGELVKNQTKSDEKQSRLNMEFEQRLYRSSKDNAEMRQRLDESNRLREEISAKNSVAVSKLVEIKTLIDTTLRAYDDTLAESELVRARETIVAFRGSLEDVARANLDFISHNTRILNITNAIEQKTNSIGKMKMDIKKDAETIERLEYERYDMRDEIGDLPEDRRNALLVPILNVLTVAYKSKEENILLLEQRKRELEELEVEVNRQVGKLEEFRQVSNRKNVEMEILKKEVRKLVPLILLMCSQIVH